MTASTITAGRQHHRQPPKHHAGRSIQRLRWLRWLRWFACALAPVLALAWTLDGPPQTGSKRGVRGVSLGLFASDPGYDYGTMLREIKALGSRHVLLALAWYQRDHSSHEIAPLPGRSPSLATLRRTIRQARSLGMEVALMPMVRLQHRRPDQWRGNLKPAGGPLLWFRSYRRFVVKLASMAAQEGVTRLAIGSELASMERYEAAWRGLIKRVREHYAGRVFYSLNWDRIERDLPFADALDEIGVTAYIPMARDTRRPSVQAISTRWARFFASLSRAQRRWKRPVFLSEIGYPALSSAALAPWDHSRKAALDLHIQAQLWRLFCRAFDAQQVSQTPGPPSPTHIGKPGVSGFYAWNWFGVGGPRDRGYAMRGKPAVQSLARCLS